jgi:hypothetical protein
MFSGSIGVMDGENGTGDDTADSNGGGAERRRPPVSEQEILIVHDVARRVEFDLEPIREALRDRLRESSDEYIWERADGIAGAALRERWSDELEDACVRALGKVHDERLVAAGRCLEFSMALRAGGSETWFSRAVLHQIGFSAVADVLEEDEFGGVALFDADCATAALRSTNDPVDR